MNIHEFNREKVLAIFDEKIEIRERGLAPRGRAAARFGLVASGVCRLARAR